MDAIYITSVTSLLLALITFFQFIILSRQNKRHFEKAQNRSLTQKLYETRLKHYPKAIYIINKLFKLKGNQYDPNVVLSITHELRQWYSGIVVLIISPETNFAYKQFLRQLTKNPEKQNRYSDKQIKKIDELKMNFRISLRRDLGFLYREEKQRRKEIKKKSFKYTIYHLMKFYE